MFARYRICICAILFTALLNMPVVAQDRPEDYHSALEASCGTETNNHCKSAPDRHGQLLACLYAHRINLSMSCEGSVVGSLERLGQSLGAHTSVRRYCDRDQRQYCKGVVTGGGNLVGCLLFARKMVSPRCKATVDRIWSKGKQTARQ